VLIGVLEEAPSGSHVEAVLAEVFLAQPCFGVNQVEAECGQPSLDASPRFHFQVITPDCVDLVVDNLFYRVPDSEVCLLDRDLTLRVLLVVRKAGNGKEGTRLVLGDCHRVDSVDHAHEICRLSSLSDFQDVAVVYLECEHQNACALAQGAQADEADLEVAVEDWTRVLDVEECHVVAA
jgi:hypothetical protein